MNIVNLCFGVFILAFISAVFLLGTILMAKTNSTPKNCKKRQENIFPDNYAELNKAVSDDLREQVQPELPENTSDLAFLPEWAKALTAKDFAKQPVVIVKRKCGKAKGYFMSSVGQRLRADVVGFVDDCRVILSRNGGPCFVRQIVK